MATLDLPPVFLDYKRVDLVAPTVSHGTFAAYEGADKKRVMVAFYKYRENSIISLNDLVALSSSYVVRRLAFNITGDILGIAMTHEKVEMTLEKYIETTSNISEEVILLFCYSMLQLVASKRMVYACINPKNILICEGFTFKLTGLPYQYRQQSQSHPNFKDDTYTHQYLPSDVSSGLTLKHDLYSIAAVIYEMATHKVPNPTTFAADNSRLNSPHLIEAISSLINHRRPTFNLTEFMRSCPGLIKFQSSQLYIDHANYLQKSNEYQSSIEDQRNTKELLTNKLTEKNQLLKEKKEELDSLKRLLGNIQTGSSGSSKIADFKPFNHKADLSGPHKNDFQSLIPTKDKNVIARQLGSDSKTISEVETLQLRLPGNRMIRIEDDLCKSLGRMLPLIPDLKQLLLRRCNLKATGLRLILCGISYLGRFELLDLSGNTNLNDTALKEIFRVFKDKPNRFKVVIKEIQITEHFLNEASIYPNITFER